MGGHHQGPQRQVCVIPVMRVRYPGVRSCVTQRGFRLIVRLEILPHSSATGFLRGKLSRLLLDLPQTQRTCHKRNALGHASLGGCGLPRCIHNAEGSRMWRRAAQSRTGWC